MKHHQQKRSARWAAVSVFTVAATAATVAITTGTGLASVDDTPGLAPVPPGQQGYLTAPAGSADGRPVVKEKKAPASLSCHRWKDGTLTQTFDPASPACVSTWDFAKGNGGSTAQGVDENLVKIGVAKSSPELEKLVTWINANYQLYGRSISLVETGGFGTPSQQRASTASAAEQGVFAMTDIDTSNAIPADTDAFLTELAKRKIIGVTGSSLKHDATLTDSGPYAWSAEKTVEGIQREAAAFTCSTLKDGTPLTGMKDNRETPAAPGTKRKFAILTPAAAELPQLRQETTALSTALQKCGLTVPVHEYQDSGYTGDASLAARDQALYQRLKAEGVTTVLFAGDGDEIIEAQAKAATAVGMAPEWVVFRGPARVGARWDNLLAEQNEKIIGLFTDLGAIDLNTEPAHRAFVAAGADPSEVAEWSNGGYRNWYSALTLIAAGIQAAGPKLTAESFAAGLESTEFPAPAVSNNPADRPRYGFQLGTHVFPLDATVARLNTKHHSSALIKYSWCPVDNGRRFGFEHPWPTSDAALRTAISTCY